MAVLRIATANTHFGQMVKADDGFTPVTDTDILLLQEVYNPKTINLKTRLEKAGFRLLHCAPQFGLAIAVRDASSVRFFPGSVQEHTLAKMGRVEHAVIKKAVNDSLPSHDRGFISCKFTVGQMTFTIVNVHPTTPISLPLGARRKQIARFTQLLATYYATHNLIIGGDMNHYPQPRKIDRALHVSANMTPVTIGQEPTWYALGSKQEPLLRVAAFLSNRPLDSFNGQHDIILYRSEFLQEKTTAVVDIQSDHRAVIATFAVK